MRQAFSGNGRALVAAPPAALGGAWPAPRTLLLRQGDRAGPADSGARADRWWRTPAVILRGWRPREEAPRPTYRERLSALILAALDRALEWQERARSRQQLLSFDDRMLHDLGIDRATAQEEGSLPFWRTRR